MKFRQLIPLLLILPFLSGCATSWEKKAVASYELIGTLPSTTCKHFELLCKDGTFPKQEKCPMLKETCNKSRKIYLTAGNVLSLAIDTSDAIQKDRWTSEYYSLMGEFNKVVIDIITLGVEMGVIKK